MEDIQEQFVTAGAAHHEGKGSLTSVPFLDPFGKPRTLPVSKCFWCPRKKASMREPPGPPLMGVNAFRRSEPRGISLPSCARLARGAKVVKGCIL